MMMTMMNDVCQLGNAQHGTGIHQATVAGILVSGTFLTTLVTMNIQHSFDMASYRVLLHNETAV